MISTLLMNTRNIIDLTTIPWDTPARTHPETASFSTTPAFWLVTLNKRRILLLLTAGLLYNM
jgi:hypothetical protein